MWFGRGESDRQNTELLNDNLRTDRNNTTDNIGTSQMTTQFNILEAAITFEQTRKIVLA